MAALSTTVAVGDANHDGMHNEERRRINTSPRPAQAIVYGSTFPSVLRIAETDASTYTWVCDGTDDQTEINAAMAAVRGTTAAGEVKCLGDFFGVTNSVLRQTAIHLELESLGCEIRAMSDFEAPIMGLFDNTTHLSSVSKVWLNGNGRRVHGIGDTANGGQVFTSRPSSNPDPSNVIRDIFITSVGSSTWAGHGMVMAGGNLRAGKYSDIRIQNASGVGVFVNGAVDSHYTNIEVGSTGSTGLAYSVSSSAPVGAGFYVSQGDNNMFTSCKAYYSRGPGFYNRGTRNGYANCQAQDNYSHGFHDVFGKSNYANCHADSNGQAYKGANGYTDASGPRPGRVLPSRWPHDRHGLPVLRQGRVRHRLGAAVRVPVHVRVHQLPRHRLRHLRQRHHDRRRIADRNHRHQLDRRHRGWRVTPPPMTTTTRG